ncbi:MAG: hypothetical protein QG553_846 [Patescibacteria group bacterium]|nr:hypothetical protein [Patescibacteria group bacterium]
MPKVQTEFPSNQDVEAVIPEGRRPYLAAQKITSETCLWITHDWWGTSYYHTAQGPLEGAPVKAAIEGLTEAHDNGTLEPPLSVDLRQVFGQMLDAAEQLRASGWGDAFSVDEKRTRDVAMLGLQAAVDHGNITPPVQ